MSKMRTVTVKGSVSTFKVGSDCDFEFEMEIPADMEESEWEDFLEGDARDAAFECIDWYFKVIEA